MAQNHVWRYTLRLFSHLLVLELGPDYFPLSTTSLLMGSVLYDQVGPVLVACGGACSWTSGCSQRWGQWW